MQARNEIIQKIAEMEDVRKGKPMPPFSTSMRQADAVWPHHCADCVLIGQVGLGAILGIELWDVYQCTNATHSWTVRTGEEPNAYYTPRPGGPCSHWSDQLVRALLAAKTTIEGRA